MPVLRWMFTKEVGAKTPRLSAASAALAAGVLSGTFFWFRMGHGWSLVAAVAFAAACFLVIYPKLREEHERQRVAGGVAVAPSLEVRIRSARPSLVRLAVLFASLVTGVILAAAFNSLWVLLAVMLAALVGVGVMRTVTGR